MKVKVFFRAAGMGPTNHSLVESIEADEGRTIDMRARWLVGFFWGMKYYPLLAPYFHRKVLSQLIANIRNKVGMKC